VRADARCVHRRWTSPSRLTGPRSSDTTKTRVGGSRDSAPSPASHFRLWRPGRSETRCCRRGGWRGRLARIPTGVLVLGPSWSPDGRLIGVSVGGQSEGGRSSIVLVPVDGSASRALFSSDYWIGRVRWLPDGAGLLTVVSDTLAEQFPDSPCYSSGSVENQILSTCQQCSLRPSVFDSATPLSHFHGSFGLRCEQSALGVRRRWCSTPTTPA
jgi:hypothetical protein